ncbi:LpxI family protein [Aquifex sp.]
MKKLGLIAGYGELPKEFVEKATQKGYKVISVGVEGITDFKTDYVIPFGKVGKLLKILEREGVEGVVMLGKFEHKLIFSDILKLDLTTFNLLRKAKDKRPETLIRTFISFLEEKGFRVIDPKPILSELLAEEGRINNVSPDKGTLENALWGFPIAKELASLDIGQTVVVKDEAVVAVEAMEGTQETIKRAGRLAGKGTIVIKVARKNQDFRIDVPTVGEETLKVMKEAGAKALFLEAGKVYIVRKERFKELANRFKIAVYGLK